MTAAQPVAIVTGAADGIGWATAQRLAADGWRVALLDLRAETAQARAAELGAQHLGLACDVTSESDVSEAVATVVARHGRIDALVNNAGGQYRTAMKTISTKGFEAVVRSNLTGGFIFMREVFNRWMEQHGGAIVNVIADIWNGWPDYAHSGAARGGMLTLTETAACEWAASGVRVNCVAPSGIASSGFDTYTPEAKAKILEFPPTVPLQRYGTEAEISSAIVYLLSPAASYITGSCLRVDGGTPNNKPSYWKLQPSRNNVPFEGFHRAVRPDLLVHGIR
jgi:citronellol/citronellal dehydrogenase